MVSFRLQLSIKVDGDSLLDPHLGPDTRNRTNLGDVCLQNNFQEVTILCTLLAVEEVFWGGSSCDFEQNLPADEVVKVDYTIRVAKGNRLNVVCKSDQVGRLRLHLLLSVEAFLKLAVYLDWVSEQGHGLIVKDLDRTLSLESVCNSGEPKDLITVSAKEVDRVSYRVTHHGHRADDLERMDALEANVFE